MQGNVAVAALLMSCERRQKDFVETVAEERFARCKPLSQSVRSIKNRD